MGQVIQLKKKVELPKDMPRPIRDFLPAVLVGIVVERAKEGHADTSLCGSAGTGANSTYALCAASGVR